MKKLIIIILVLVFTQNCFASVLFNGSSQYLKSIATTTGDLGSGDFTISMMVKFSSLPAATYPVIISKWLNSPNRAWEIYYDVAGVKLYFQYSTTGSDGPNVSSAWTPTVNIWYNIIIVRSGSNINKYINGSLLTSTAIGAITIFNNSAQITEGVDFSAADTPIAGDYFPGEINEVAMWNVALSQSEIQTLAKSKVKGMPLNIHAQNLQFYCPMSDIPFNATSNADYQSYPKMLKMTAVGNPTCKGDQNMSYPE